MALGSLIENQEHAALESYGTGSIRLQTCSSLGLWGRRAVVGEHAVMFASTGERLELHHKASDRSIYAAGAVTAGLWVRDKSPGMYSMKDVLGINS